MSNLKKIYTVSNEENYYHRYRQWIPQSEETVYPNKADLFLFTGGEDVHPYLYGELKNKKTRANSERDVQEIWCFKYALNNKIPMMGICRGSQFLTVMAGGGLFQHVDGHIGNHTSFLSDGSVITTISTHHQMMNPYSLKPQQYKVIGVSKKIISEFENGYNETVELPSNFPEPEFVYYPEINALAIQGHPERQLSDDSLEEQIVLFEDFYEGNMHKWEDIKYQNNYEY